MRFIVTMFLLALAAVAQTPPNVVIVITDDQGYGDFGFQGNDVLRTPHLDALAARSARMNTFYVNPVCAPTRAALMTGRYPQRTTAIDTYIGRAMLGPQELTLAELLRDAGWATGIFGKWHLGDCYPMRAMDQGFDEAWVHRGGGIGQSSDPLGAEGKYTDPVLLHNGHEVTTEGYCTDVYFDRAIRWMSAMHANERPFFAYIPTNAPHGPFHDVPRKLLEEYRKTDLSPSRFPQNGHPLPEKWNEKRLADIFAMITNVDENVGRLVKALDTMGATRDTLVLFMLDNGPNTRRYTAGLRGRKGEVYEGGIRSPLLACWPARLEPGIASERIGAHIDILPTVLEACGVTPPKGHALDGRSLLPLLERRAVTWPDRTLVVQSHRGDAPVRYHHAMIRRGRWKLVSPTGFGRELERVEPRFELYDLAADPYERKDVATANADVVTTLRAAYDAWFDDVGGTDPSRYAPPSIHVGSAREPRTVLTRQDWRRISRDGGPNPHSMGAWHVEFVRDGVYDFRLVFPRRQRVEQVELRVGRVRIAARTVGREHRFESIRIPKGKTTVEVRCRRGEKRFGAYQVMITPSP